MLVPWGGQGEVGLWHTVVGNRRSWLFPARGSCQVRAEEEPELEAAHGVASRCREQAEQNGADGCGGCTDRDTSLFCSQGARQHQLQDAP